MSILLIGFRRYCAARQTTDVARLARTSSKVLFLRRGALLKNSQFAITMRRRARKPSPISVVPSDLQLSQRLEASRDKTRSAAYVRASGLANLFQAIGLVVPTGGRGQHLHVANIRLIALGIEVNLRFCNRSLVRHQTEVDLDDGFVRSGSRPCENAHCFICRTGLWVLIVCRDGFPVLSI